MDEDRVLPICLEATQFAGVDVHLVADMLPTFEQDIEELADALRIDVVPSSVYAIVAKAIRDRLVASTEG